MPDALLIPQQDGGLPGLFELQGPVASPIALSYKRFSAQPHHFIVRCHDRIRPGLAQYGEAAFMAGIMKRKPVQANSLTRNANSFSQAAAHAHSDHICPVWVSMWRQTPSH